MPVAAAVVGVAVSAYGAYKQHQMQKKALQQQQYTMSPEAIKARMQAINPQLYNAAYGPNIFKQDTANLARATNMGDYLDQLTGLRQKVSENRLQAMFNMAGYQDPTTYNYGLSRGMSGMDTALQGASAMIGRRGLEGGMADAYAFANRAAKQNMAAQAYQQFRAQGEMLARQDTIAAQNMLASAAGQATQANLSQAGMIQAPSTNPWSIAGQTIGTGLAAYGAFAKPAGTGAAAAKSSTFGDTFGLTGDQYKSYQTPYFSQYNIGGSQFQTPTRGFSFGSATPQGGF